LKRASKKYTPKDDQKPVQSYSDIDRATSEDTNTVTSDVFVAPVLRQTDDTQTHGPEGENYTKKKRVRRILRVLICDAKFDVGIFDEGQMLKNRGSWTRLMVDTLVLKAKILVTATPMSNCPKDMYGVLSLLWDENIPFKPMKALKWTTFDIKRRKKVHVFDAKMIFDPNFDPSRPRDRWNKVMESMVPPICSNDTPEMREARKGAMRQPQKNSDGGQHIPRRSIMHSR